MCGGSLIGTRVQFFSVRVTFNGGIKLRRVERLKPCAEPCELVQRKLLNGPFDFFGSRHVANVSPTAL